MPQSSGLTYEQLVAMGAKPGSVPAQTKSGLTYAQMVAMGAKPGPALKPATPVEGDPGILAKTGEAIIDVAKGVGKGAVNTSLGISKIVGTVPGDTSLEDVGMEPTNAAQKIGFGAEQIGEFFIPGGVVTKGTKAIEGVVTAASKLPSLVKGAVKLGSKVGLEVAGAGAVTAAQSAGDLDATKNAAMIAGAIPVAGKAIEPLANIAKKLLSKALPGRIVESIIKPAKALKKFGSEPGQEVAVQGLKSNTLEGLEKEIGTRLNQVGKFRDAMLAQPQFAAKSVNVADAINGPIDEAIKRASVDGNKALIQRLEDFRDGQFAARFGVQGKIKKLNLTPLEATKLKTDIGKGFRWSEDPIEGTLNDVRQDIYREVRAAVDQQVPGVRELNRSYANLLNAEKAVNARVDAVSKLNFVGMTEAMAAVTASLAGAAISGDLSGASIYGLLGLAGIKGVRMSGPGVGSRTAAALAQFTPDQKTTIATALVPVLRNIWLAANATDRQQ